jgi:hypothetical protein
MAAPLTGFAFSAGISPNATQPFNAFTPSTFTAPNEASTASTFTTPNEAFPIIDFQPPTLKLTRSLSHQMAANINAKQYMPLCKEGDTILTNYFISYGSVTFTFLTRIGDEFHETVIDEESVHDSMKRTFTFSTCKDFHEDLFDFIKQNRIYIAYLKAKEASIEPPCNKCKWNTFDGYLAGKTKCCCPIKYKEE